MYADPALVSVRRPFIVLVPGWFAANAWAKCLALPLKSRHSLTVEPLNVSEAVTLASSHMPRFGMVRGSNCRALP
jgi:hypothetical protein